MTMQWTYPVYLVPLPGGYASIDDETSADQKSRALVVFTDEEKYRQFTAGIGIDSDPKPLKNAREFAWLLQNIKAPVARVAFDPPADGQPPQWSAGIDELLQDHLVIDYSPWNYPVFVVDHGGGFATIEGKKGEGQTVMRAVALFTDQAKAREYLIDADESGTIRSLNDLDQTRAFLSHVSHDANAVAVNPVVENGKRTAKHCFDLQTVLEKYLVRQN